jgi:hypothetical protein
VVIFFHAIPFLCFKYSPVDTIIKDQAQKIKKKTGLSCAGLCALVLLIPFCIHFPGFTSADTHIQWMQVQQFRFDNWHPVVHTFIIWLVTRFCNHYAFVVLCQILLFAYAVGYLVATLESWGFSRKWLYVLGIFIILNPFTQGILLYLWKDAAFTILLVFLATYLINIYLTNGKWLTQWKHLLAFSFCVALATLVRHNGMFFTVPLLCLVLFFYMKSHWKVTLTILLAGILIVLIRFPFYSALKVSYPDNAYTEAIGLPMVIMGNVMVKNPQALPDETKNFLLAIAPGEEWKNQYIPNEYNSVKTLWHVSDFVSNISAKDFAGMTLKTIRSDKRNSFLAVKTVTSSVWGIFGEFENVHVFSEKESLLNEPNLWVKFLKNSLFAFDNLIVSIPLLGGLFTKIGLHMLLLLLAGIFSLYKNGAKALLLITPPVVYNLGTMLLLCTVKDLRFFHFNVVITLPFLFVLLSKSCHK